MGSWKNLSRPRVQSDSSQTISNKATHVDARFRSRTEESDFKSVMTEPTLNNLSENPFTEPNAEVNTMKDELSDPSEDGATEEIQHCHEQIRVDR